MQAGRLRSRRYLTAIARPLPVLTNPLPQCARHVDVLREVAFLNETVGPDPPDQLFLRDDPAALFDERRQYLKSLLRQRHDLTAAVITAARQNTPRHVRGKRPNS